MKDLAVARARDYMSSRVVTVRPEMDVLDAMRTLLDERISGAPVVDAHGNLVGVLTQRDCMTVAVQALYHQQPAGRVAEYMTADVKTLPANASLPDVIDAFRSSPFRRFPVVDDGRLVGVLSRRDILHAILELW